jgi:tRNA(fMet)-specific endonuclease VapC
MLGICLPPPFPNATSSSSRAAAIRLSDLVRNPAGRVANRIKVIGEALVRTVIIVAAELRFEATKRGSARLPAQVEAVLGGLYVLPFEAPADAIYGQIRSKLERSGTAIGGNDLLIAAQALALDDTLVTTNDAEFARVVGLRRENWLAHS